MYYVMNILMLSFVYSGDEEEEPAVNVTAPMSTSQTLVLSETHPTAEETSPPEQDLQRSTPAASPRASSPKRARIELGEEHNIVASSATPPLDDVSILSTPVCILCQMFLPL
jgi:hypothetical protein